MSRSHRPEPERTRRQRRATRPFHAFTSCAARRFEAAAKTWWIAIVVLALAATALAFAPREGTHVYLFADDGSSLVGYGQVIDGVIDVVLSERAQAFTVLLIHPDGAIEARQGRREGLDRLLVDVEDGATTDLETRLAELGIGVRVHVGVSIASVYGTDIAYPPAAADAPPPDPSTEPPVSGPSEPDEPLDPPPLAGDDDPLPDDDDLLPDEEDPLPDVDDVLPDDDDDGLPDDDGLLPDDDEVLPDDDDLETPVDNPLEDPLDDDDGAVSVGVGTL